MSKETDMLRMLAKMKGKQIKDIIKGESSRTAFYDRERRDDMKVAVFKRFLGNIGCELWVHDKDSDGWWQVK